MERNTNVIITGAGGFIGHHLARHLKKKFYVIGIDLHEPQFSGMDDFDEFHTIDLRYSFPSYLFVNRQIDRIYALAAQNGSIEYTTSNKADLMHDNVLINVTTAEACVKHKVKRLFFSSSACVYPLRLQYAKGEFLKEDMVYPAYPDTEYGWEKLFSERLYQSYSQDHDLEVRIARFFNIYGPECLIDTMRSKAPMALTRKVIEAGDKKMVDVWGSGKAIRSYCYIDDCVRAIDMLTDSDIKEPVNIGTKDHVSVDQLVDMIAEIEGVTVYKNHQLDKIEGVRSRLCNTDRVETLLNWSPEVSMREGLRAINTFVHAQLQK